MDKSKTERARLPFRKNCEGYFTDKKGNILAKKSDAGYIIFPGGGIDEQEDIREGMKRETFEETGARIKNMKRLGEIKIMWGPDWAKTEKQKARYDLFQGDDMHFFAGEIEKFEEPPKKEEDFWDGEKLMPLTEVIALIKAGRGDNEMNEYREMQLKLLKNIEERIVNRKTP